jgi:prevent-host-death family protein
MVRCDYLGGEQLAMNETRVNVRELKARLSHYLRLTKAGQAVVITERGVPIGQIVPVGGDVRARLEQLRAVGLVEWDGERLGACEAVPRLETGRTLAELLLDDRE